MRQLMCAVLIIMSLLQWSWAGVHAASEASHAVTHTQESQAGNLAADADSHEECCVQAHCCHPHSTALPGELPAALGLERLCLTPKLLSEVTLGALPTDIERPKWVMATPAVATV